MNLTHRNTAKHWIWTDRTLHASEIAFLNPDLAKLSFALNPLDIDHITDQDSGWGSAWHSKNLSQKALKLLPDVPYVLQQIPCDTHQDFVYACISSLTRAGYTQSFLYLHDPFLRLRHYISICANFKERDREICSAAIKCELQDRLLIRGAIDLLESKSTHFHDLPLTNLSDIDQAPWRLDNDSSTEFTSLLRQHLSRVFEFNPNYDGELLGDLSRAESYWLPDVRKTVKPLRPIFRITDEKDMVKEFRSSPLPHNVWPNQSFNWAGSVYLKEQKASDQLYLEMNKTLHPLIWGQSSPVIAKIYPDDAAAKFCRFREVKLIANQSPRIEVLAASGDERSSIGAIEFSAPSPAYIDGILVNSHSLGYTPIPKVACTSIKEFLFELMHGEPFTPSLIDDSTHVHQFFDRRLVPINFADHRIIVVRDPIQRFLSGYSNRVLHHKELTEEYILRQPNGAAFLAKNLPTTPDIDVFVENFESYRAVATIDHHFRPISEYIPTLECYTNVYPFERLNDFFSDLMQITKKSAAIRHAQRGGSKIDKSRLSPDSLIKLKRIFAADYDLLGQHYRAPE
ncbi:sulfotransferase family 2 domain-containing protein [Ideonella paludis]|uniref:Sulfotransferase family 2 domain-containing protein n=1 Tax=Ideonella paludis TaxID=1233411 RepID=A0ABS5DRL9_9BURK|nr:sulfotransferase family 2 domain-containing protein [Ideonella paludis]MBQ0933777.1 sulfotransferase family 2 domain-containing protein [Ideonella paludis]